MEIAIPKERPDESRIAIMPQTVEKLVKLGANINIEAGLGSSLQLNDEEYKQAGAKIVANTKALLKNADIILRINKPEIESINDFKKESIHISFLDPFRETALIHKLAAQNINTISMEMIPRTTIAQKMDALSSQANLAGYASVIIAAAKLNKAFPMMMTAAGTISPVKVFVIGVGVAGLQAIATAKRLGARVEAFDTRPIVEEQVRSLGAKFVKIDIGETGQTKEGYAKELTPEQLEKQRQGMAKACAAADIIITTAQIFGKKAPQIVSKDMIAGMNPGSVVVDMAVETGGNVAGSKSNETVVENGVYIIGHTNLPGTVAFHASQMYANNLYNLIEHFWNRERNQFQMNLDDEIMKACLLTHDGKIINERLKGI